MTYWEKYVNIQNSQNSPIQLDGIVCDGYLKDKTIAVITHFHYDHIKDIEKMLTKYDKIIVTPITYQALIALNSSLEFRQQFVSTNYGTEFRTDESTITLYDSNHIPGSCSVLVEYDGKRILYSGDFNYPNLHTPKCDYLVLDATHGNPKYDYETIDRKVILQKMASTVCEKIQNKEQVVITSDRGTLQEIIQYFETISDTKIPNHVCFLSKDKDIRILEALYKEVFPYKKSSYKFSNRFYLGLFAWFCIIFLYYCIDCSMRYLMIFFHLLATLDIIVFLRKSRIGLKPLIPRLW